MARVLVAGIGNIFLGDDAFGCEAARRLAERPQPEGVYVRDFGIRGFDLAYALLEGYDGAILLDATQRGGAPGTLYVLEPDLGDEAGSPAVDAHALDPAKVLRLVRTLGGEPCRWLRVVGCEPATFGTEEDPRMELSPPVRAAVERAVVLVESLVREVFAKPGKPSE